MNTNTTAAVCSSHGLVRLASSYADAQRAADQHHTVHGCWAHVRIEATR